MAFHFSGDSLIGEKWAQSGRKKTLLHFFFCQQLTGGVSLDGCLLLRFLRVPAGEGSVTPDLTTSVLDVLVLDSQAFKAGVSTSNAQWDKTCRPTLIYIEKKIFLHMDSNLNMEQAKLMLFLFAAF